MVDFHILPSALEKKIMIFHDFGMVHFMEQAEKKHMDDHWIRPMTCPGHLQGDFLGLPTSDTGRLVSSPF